MSNFVKKLSPGLFWDVDVNELDERKHRRFIIQRVLERGSISDWKNTKAFFSVPTIVSEAQRMRSLEPKSLAFIACVGDVPLDSFRCYTSKQSNQKHWSC